MFDIDIILRSLPELIVWGIGLVFSIRMVQRGGGIAEKLLLAGCICLLAQALLGAFAREIVTEWLNDEGLRAADFARNMLYVNIPLTVLTVGGAIVLIVGFWKRFVAKKPEDR